MKIGDKVTIETRFSSLFGMRAEIVGEKVISGKQQWLVRLPYGDVDKPLTFGERELKLIGPEKNAEKKAEKEIEGPDGNKGLAGQD